MNNDKITEALQMLLYHRESMFDFPPAKISDDGNFAIENPDHPCSGNYRFRRQRGADYFNDLADSDPNAVDSKVLDELHESLFDRDPAVRLIIAEALGKLVRASSIPYLEKLLAAEDESNWVRSAAELSLGRCRSMAESISCPSAEITPPEMKKKRFVADSAFVLDMFTGQRHFGRRVFDIDAAEFDEVNLSPSDRAQMFADIGLDGCVAVLQRAFNAQDKPYNAKDIIDSLVRADYLRKNRWR